MHNEYGPVFICLTTLDLQSLARVEIRAVNLVQQQKSFRKLHLMYGVSSSANAIGMLLLATRLAAHSSVSIALVDAPAAAEVD